jgi:hypothetical protein
MLQFFKYFEAEDCVADPDKFWTGSEPWKILPTFCNTKFSQKMAYLDELKTWQMRYRYVPYLNVITILFYTKKVTEYRNRFCQFYSLGSESGPKCLDPDLTKIVRIRPNPDPLHVSYLTARVEEGVENHPQQNQGPTGQSRRHCYKAGFSEHWTERDSLQRKWRKIRGNYWSTGMPEKCLITYW